MCSLGFSARGELEATASPPPPSDVDPAVCGPFSASKPRQGVGAAAAVSAVRSPAPRGRYNPAVFDLETDGWSPDGTIEDGSGCPNPCGKETVTPAHKSPPRVSAGVHTRPWKPPDRIALAAAPTLLKGMASSMHKAGKKALVAEANPEVGGGTYGAPSVDVACPKPSNGGSVAAGRSNPRL